jgi:hypothetical protein
MAYLTLFWSNLKSHILELFPFNFTWSIFNVETAQGNLLITHLPTLQDLFECKYNFPYKIIIRMIYLERLNT